MYKFAILEKIWSVMEKVLENSYEKWIKTRRQPVSLVTYYDRNNRTIDIRISVLVLIISLCFYAS